MAWSENGTVIIKNLWKSNSQHTEKIRQIKGVSTGEKPNFKENSNALEISFPNQKQEASYGNVLKII